MNTTRNITRVLSSSMHCRRYSRPTQSRAKFAWSNLEPRNIPPNRSCCNTAHPFGSNDLDSPPKRRFSTRTHTHIFRFPRIHKWRHTQRTQQRRPQPTACETTVRNAVGLTTRCHLTNHDRGEQLTPSSHHDQKVERHCPS